MPLFLTFWIARYGDFRQSAVGPGSSALSTSPVSPDIPQTATTERPKFAESAGYYRYGQTTSALRHESLEQSRDCEIEASGTHQLGAFNPGACQASILG
jgi:hypothetical protein